jgi:proline iminopeptidase
MRKYLIVIIFMVSGFFSMAEERIIETTDGVKLHVTVKGQGLPLLYVHGGPGSGAYWMEYFAGDILESRFQVVYVDQRGVSRSTSPENGDYSPTRMAMDFEEVREALSIEKWLTFGHSFGGILQMAYYEHAPQSILGMLMINCSLDFNGAVDNLLARAILITDSQEDEYLNNADIPRLDRAMAGIAKAQELGVWWQMHYDEKDHYELMAEVMGHIENWNGDFSGKAIFMEEYFRDYAPMAKTVEVPVLVFYGERDHAIGYDHYELMDFPLKLIRSYPGVHVPFIDGKPYLEEAFDAYLEFYDQQLLVSK